MSLADITKTVDVKSIIDSIVLLKSVLLDRGYTSEQILAMEKGEHVDIDKAEADALTEEQKAFEDAKKTE